MNDEKAYNVLALCGLAPAVITETLWDLLRRHIDIPVLHVVTTQNGAQRFHEDLAGEDGAIFRLWDVWASDKPLPDIRMHVFDCADMAQEADHWHMADRIGKLVRNLTDKTKIPLYASAAGGRKTMSMLLALAMSLYARPEDRLIHILADPDLEINPDFFFPSRGAENHTGIYSVDVPFPRLSRFISAADTENMADLVRVLDDRFEQAEPLQVFPRNCCIILRKITVHLPPRMMAVYLMFARHRQKTEAGFSLNAPDFELLRSCCIDSGMQAEKADALLARLQSEDPKPWFLEQISRLRHILRKNLGPVLAQDIGIEKLGVPPHTHYRLRLANWQVFFNK